MISKRLMAAIGLLFAPPASVLTLGAVDPPIVDDTIHILAVKEPGVSQSRIDAQMSMIEYVWTNSQYSNGAAPVTVTVINPGAAVSTLVNLTGSNADQIVQAKIFASTSLVGNPSIRDGLAADVVIVFVDELEPGYCGFAPQNNWGPPNNEYVEDPLTNNLDLRGSDDIYDATNHPGGEGFYIGLVANGLDCIDPDDYQDLAVHEFGHLLGAGHHSGVGGLQPGLYPQSRALVFDMFAPWLGTRTWRTVMGAQKDVACSVQGIGGKCWPVRRWSDRFYADLSRMNTDSIDATAVAVANYRTGMPAFGLAEECFDDLQRLPPLHR